jgi:hypothetical protein
VSGPPLHELVVAVAAHNSGWCVLAAAPPP